MGTADRAPGDVGLPGCAMDDRRSEATGFTAETAESSHEPADRRILRTELN